MPVTRAAQGPTGRLKLAHRIPLTRRVENTDIDQHYGNRGPTTSLTDDAAAATMSEAGSKGREPDGPRAKRRSVVRIVIVALFVALLLPALSGRWYLSDAREDQLQADLESRLHGLSASLAVALSEPLWNVDEAMVRHIIDGAFNNGDLRRVVVSDASLGTVVDVRGARAFAGQQVSRRHEIVLGEETIGQVEVVFDDGGIRRVLAADNRSNLLVLAGQMGVSFLLMLAILNLRVLRPLRELEAASERLGRGELDAPVPGLHEDEVGRLAVRLDDMRTRLRASFAEQRALLDTIPMAIVFVRDGRVVLANRRAERYYELSQEELLGRHPKHLYADPEVRERIEREAEPLMARGEIYRGEMCMRGRNGEEYCEALSGVLVDAGRGDAGALWVAEDVTARRQSEERIRLWAKVFDNTADGVLIADDKARIVAVNRAFERITGYAAGEVAGKNPSLLKSGRQDGAFYEQMWADLNAGRQWSGELWNRRKSGELYPQWLTISPVRDEQGSLTHYVGVFSDITAIKRSQEQLDFLAHHDSLTGLPNRLLAMDRLEQALSRAGRDGSQVAVMFVDLDHFKNVNDTLGHHYGDQLLRAVSASLSEMARGSDTVARLGGDEFVAILERFDEALDASVVAERMLDVFRRPILLGDVEAVVTGSIGIALYPDDGRDIETLTRNADAAMYLAKREGRNGYRFYTPELTAQASERLQLESLLRMAIERDELRLHLQPQVSMNDRSLVGAEALVRWEQRDLGLVMPDRFIGLAEDTGFIHELGAWVLREACRQWRELATQGLVLGKLAVNVSAKQLDREDFVATVRDILAESGVEPTRIQLEVTESSLMESSAAMERLEELRAIGVELAIDDFGTGYSSLAYLKRMPVQTLKIDRSFVRDIAVDVDDEAIAAAVIRLAQSLGMSVVAEGVETDTHSEFLVRHGCPIAQGYLYGRPVPMEELLAAWSADHILD